MLKFAFTKFIFPDCNPFNSSFIQYFIKINKKKHVCLFFPHSLLDKPIIHVPKKIVNTGPSQTAELRCDYNSHPRAQSIRWFFNGTEIDEKKHADKYSIHNSGLPQPGKNQNRTALTVKNIKENDIGNYVCAIKNTEGEHNHTILLTFKPERAHYVGSEIVGKDAAINWTVASIEPLKDVFIFYQHEGNKEWMRRVDVLNEQDKDTKLWT